MKNIMFILSIFLISFLPVFAQQPADDPLADSYIIQVGGGNEIITNSEGIVGIYKYFKDSPLYSSDTLIQVLYYYPNVYTVSSDIICDDLDNDGFAEIITARLVYDPRQVDYTLLKADPSLLSIDSLADWDKVVEGTVQGLPAFDPPGWGVLSPVMIQTGNFDSDELKEFVLAYWGDNQVGDGVISIQVFDVDDSLQVTPLAEISDQRVCIPAEIGLCEDQMYLFDLECADFNGDGIDEILLAGRDSLAGGGWEMYASIYELDTINTELVLKSHASLYSNPNPLYDIANLNVAAGHFESIEQEQGVISLFRYIPTAEWGDALTDTVTHILVPFETDESLEQITAGEPCIQMQDTIPRDCWYNSNSVLIGADVNADSLDEIISSYSQTALKTLKIFQGTSSLQLSVWADLDDLAEEDVGSVTVGNVVTDTSGAAPWMELVIATTDYPNYYTRLYQIHFDAMGGFMELELRDELPYMECWGKAEPLQSAELDADIRLGKPARYTLTSILQPLVILNAPPIHFDVLGSESYDVSLSYNENDGQFISHYAKESSQSTEVTSEFTQDWGTSQTLKAGGSYWGVSVSAYLTTKYGKQFSKSGGHSTTVTVSIAVDAKEDDRIYATVMDYDLWEYPVYGNTELQGHVLVVRPLVTENRWFPSKSWSGYSYIPTHEVGNILSYREYPLLTDNPEIEEKIKGDYNNSFVLDANSSYDWSLQFDDFATNQASTSKSYSREWGVDVDVWGSGYSLNSSYNQNEIYTHKTDVSSGLSLSVHLDGIDMGLGEVSYIVTPYSYWATNGALVLDYAVRPELAPPGGTDTWWQVHYSDWADPAFILPWRCDPEKGFTLEDEAKRMQTKDLVFLPADPKDGDIVLIQARVHNFSLIPTPGIIGVKFFIGDPASGGTPIIGTMGEEQVFTAESVPARGSTLVSMHWQIPAGLPTFPRIYVVIDRYNTLQEIHEDNNKSWAILQKTTSTAIAVTTGGIPLNFTLKQNYPNPFNPTTTIEFALPKSEWVTLKVFNVLGQKVASLVSENLNPGIHKYEWQADNLPSGIYYCRLHAGEFEQVRKMVLLK
jgi:hypothetical protein